MHALHLAQIGKYLAQSDAIQPTTQVLKSTVMNLKCYPVYPILLLVLFAPLHLSAELGIVWIWDRFNNRPDYLLGATVTPQTSPLNNEQLGVLFNVLSDKGSTVKQATSNQPMEPLATPPVC
ncbi:MAG: hypothetical protein LR015_03595 [Verrucomicrobia bacterium]|nr:hypothetical protein [Verrucomicrobiota bacterium]